MKKYIWITLLWLGSIPYAYAQIGNKGVPYIRNFTYEQYQAGAQNRFILQDDDGNMLFGNNYGLLEYNGHRWSLIVQPPNKTVVWSLHKDKKGTIYLGAQNEFGYVKRNDAGQKRYISLVPKIPQGHRQFNDIWAILETSEGIFFHASEAIFRYSDDTIRVLDTPPIAAFSKVGDSILVQDAELNIHVVKPEGLRKVIDGKRVGHYVLKMYEDPRGGLQFVTQHQGILYYENGTINQKKAVTNSFLKDNKIHSLHKLRNNHIALGSVGAGLLILDDQFQPIQWLNKGNGLQSNTILAMGSDHIGNLWVATEAGIDYVEIATPLYKIADHYRLEGTVSSTLLIGKTLYVGTNTGVFYSQWETLENPLKPTLQFHQFGGISGQVWNLYEIEGSLYVCHHDGLFRIHGKEISQIFYGQGAWNLLRLSDQSSYYLQGAYNGIHLYELKDDKLTYKWKIEGFDETSRIIQMDHQGTLWMAHGYKGIYKLRLDDHLKTFAESRLYTEKDGFPTSLFINLFKVKNRILFGTEFGTYHYDPQEDTMILEPLYAQILGTDMHIRLLQEDQGKVWFIKGHDMHDEMGVIDLYDDRFEVMKAPLQHLRGKFNPGFESVTVADKNTVLFGTKNGIVLFDRSNNRTYNRTYKARIREVRCIANDSLLFGQTAIDRFQPIQPSIGEMTLPYDLNSIDFTYASDYFESPENTRYSYFLEGFDRGWHDWSPDQSRRFTNLDPGTYTFRVKALNIYEAESEGDRYSFTILPPWYLTRPAMAAYLLLLFVLFVGLRRLYKLRIERAQRNERLTQQEVLQKNKQQHMEEKLHAEQELISLRNEKLEAEIEISRSKMEVLNAEMAASIMMITQKNSVLMKVRDDLGKLHKKAKESNKGLIERVIRNINTDIDSDQDWHQFKIHFDKVHEDFLERLKQEYPDLSPKDLQLAAYLRLNLSSKEIASMMNITIRSIEGCRYRLRKHLNLSGQTNLNEFILKF